MIKHIGLLSSLVASAVVTLAASPAQAQSALDWASGLASNIQPASNAWNTPCVISWGDGGTAYSASTNGACLYTLALKKSDPSITNALLSFWWGSANPGSPTYHDQIVAGTHFTNITDFATAQPGDLLAAKYSSSTGNTGYLMILASSASEGISNGVELFHISVIDSTRAPHGESDSRWNKEANGGHDFGVGTGEIYVYADGVTGAILGHTWSTAPNGSYYPQAERHLVVGRFFR